MYVYRVEHPDTGIGPYQLSSSEDWADSGGPDMLCDSHNYDMARPSAFADPLLRDVPVTRAALFGFSSVAMLKVWFTGWLRRLHRAGFRLAVYEVNSRAVAHGTGQVLFDSSAAERVGYKSLLARS